ncbi:MAG: hypothetical protein LCH67_08600 [Bacteroidetes bacterium]|nr:hypothetical protein [Bacteroidota bacterium]
MESTLQYQIPLSVNELAKVIKEQFSLKDRNTLADLIKIQPDNGDDEPTKEQLLDEIREAVKEVNLAKQGKIKLKTLDQLLDEL